MDTVLDTLVKYLPLLIPLILIQFGLMLFAIFDLIKRPRTRGPKWVWAIVILVVNLIRMASHTVSGVLFYEVTWWGSLAYNGWYMIPTMIVALIVVTMLLPRLRIRS